MSLRGAFSVLLVVVMGCSSGVSVPDTEDSAQVDLAQAVIDESESTVREILDAHPELVSQTNSVGQTPLHYAARTGNAAIVSLLIERGADVYALNDEDEMPLAIAERSGASNEVLEMLEGVQ